MKLIVSNIYLTAMFLVLCCNGSVVAAEKTPAPALEESVAVVQVTAIRDVDEVPYERIYKGLQVFEQNRQLAPNAELRFRLYPRAKKASFDHLKVRLVGEKTDIPVVLDENHAFSLPKNADWVKDKVYVTTNKKAGTYAWRVDIRTPGLPPNTRRMGDLRLECRVDMKGAELRHMVRDPSIMALVAVGDPCTYRTFTNPFFSEYPLFNVTLVSGERKNAIASEWLYANASRGLPEAVYAELTDWAYARDRQYIPPIADASWPDDTLLFFDYMDEPPAPVRQAATDSPDAKVLAGGQSPQPHTTEQP